MVLTFLVVSTRIFQTLQQNPCQLVFWNASVAYIGRQKVNKNSFFLVQLHIFRLGIP